MISVLIHAANAERLLSPCLASLVPAAIDGVVREVILIAASPTEAVLSLAEDSGAGLAGDLAAAVRAARSDWLLVLDRPVRLEDGWHGEAAVHVRHHAGRSARFRAGWLGRAGLLVRKDRHAAPGRPRVLNSRAYP